MKYKEKQFKELVLKLVKEKYKDVNMYNRAVAELDLLSERKMLYAVYLLHKYKFANNYDYRVCKTLNNLLVLYVLGISNVDPIEYNLPYELCNSKIIEIELIEPEDILLIEDFYQDQEEFTFLKGNYTKTNDADIDSLENNHYIIVPSKKATKKINDYHKYKGQFAIIRISSVPYFKQSDISIRNVYTSKVELVMDKFLKPTTILEYSKIVSASRGTDVWLNNQENIVKEVRNFIATSEDVYEYLLQQKINKDIALDIVNIVRLGKQNENKEKWLEYCNIMKNYNCSNTFIEIISNILFLSGRGDGISRCLWSLQPNNYL